MKFTRHELSAIRSSAKKQGKRTVYWYDGEYHSVASLARNPDCVVKQNTLSQRLVKLGYSVKQAMTEPARQKQSVPDSAAIAARLGVSRDTVYRRAKRGELE